MDESSSLVSIAPPLSQTSALGRSRSQRSAAIKGENKRRLVDDSSSSENETEYNIPAKPKASQRRPRSKKASTTSVTASNQSSSPTKRARVDKPKSGISRTRSLQELPRPVAKPISSTSQSFSGSIPPNHKNLITSSVPFPSSLSEINTETWQLAKLRSHGTYVWVNMTTKGVIGNDGVLWWPSQVTSSDPLKVSVFSFFPDEVTTILEVQDPDQSTILSFRDPTTSRLRFSRTTYSKPNLWEEFDQRWLDGLKHVEEDDDDDLIPGLGSDSFLQTSSQHIEANSDVEDEAESRERLLLEYKFLQAQYLLGTDVLARGKRPYHMDYWPARIVKVVPWKVGDEEIKFDLEFFSGEHRQLPRSEFYTVENAEYFTCSFGQIKDPGSAQLKSSQKRRDVSPTLRGASPPPRYPPPESFEELSVREQVRYIVPALTRIICDEYPPSLERADIFYSGGRDREGLSRQVNYGPLGVIADDLTEEIRRFALRDEERAQRVEEDAPEPQLSERVLPTEPDEVLEPQPWRGQEPDLDSDVPPPSSAATILARDSSEGDDESVQDGNESPPNPEELKDSIDNHIRLLPTQPSRLKGSPRYEALDRSSRSQFSLDVLVPEAVVLLLLWRKGLVKDNERLTDEEEAQLYREGQILVSEPVDADVAMYERALALRASRDTTSKAIAGRQEVEQQSKGIPNAGTSSRPKYVPTSPKRR